MSKDLRREAGGRIFGEVAVGPRRCESCFARIVDGGCSTCAAGSVDAVEVC